MTPEAPTTGKKIMNYQINISKILIVILIAVCLKLGWDYYMKLQTELRIATQNNEALVDSVRVTKNKLNEVVYSKQIFVAETQKDLKKLNADLAKTVKNFNGAIHSITELEAKIDGLAGQISDPGEVIELPSGEKGIMWSFSQQFDENNSRVLEGITKFNFDPNTSTFSDATTEISKDLIKFKLIQGLRTTKDGKVEVFASSNYPGFTAESLNSVLIDPKTHPALTKFTKEKKWHFGVYGGYGATANLSTGLVNFGPQIGFGAMYKIF